MAAGSRFDIYGEWEVGQVELESDEETNDPVTDSDGEAEVEMEAVEED